VITIGPPLHACLRCSSLITQRKSHDCGQRGSTKKAFIVTKKRRSAIAIHHKEEIRENSENPMGRRHWRKKDTRSQEIQEISEIPWYSYRKFLSDNYSPIQPYPALCKWHTCVLRRIIDQQQCNTASVVTAGAGPTTRSNTCARRKICVIAGK